MATAKRAPSVGCPCNESPLIVALLQITPTYTEKIIKFKQKIICENV